MENPSQASSQPSSSQKNQSFLEMITAANDDQEDDDGGEEVGFIFKKESLSPLKGNLSVKVEPKTIDQKPNTLRLKHSATEQRRRSKINDMFQKLRKVIPNGGQKRDKASFLLQVNDYIQLLQEKVYRYESRSIAEGFSDHTQTANIGQNSVGLDTNTATTIKESVEQPELTSEAAQMQPNNFSFNRTCMLADSLFSPKQQLYDTDKTMTSQAAKKLEDQKPSIESGVNDISSVYSQRLLNALTETLQTSGVDVSKASISVQIDLGKNPNSNPRVSTGQ